MGDVAARTASGESAGFRKAMGKPGGGNRSASATACVPGSRPSRDSICWLKSATWASVRMTLSCVLTDSKNVRLGAVPRLAVAILAYVLAASTAAARRHIPVPACAARRTKRQLLAPGLESLSPA